MKFNHWIAILIGSSITALAIAKLPPPAPMNDEQKAKADETKAKAADAAKKASADEQRYQDRSAERYFKEMKAANKTVPPSTWVPPVAPVTAPATPAAPATAAPVAADKPATVTAPAKKA